MADNKPDFVKGLFFNKPSEKAPSFVLGSIAIKPSELIEWLRTAPVNPKGYTYLDVKTQQKDPSKVNVSVSEFHHPPQRQQSAMDASDRQELPW